MESGNESHRICRVHGLGADWAGSEEATEIAGNSNQEACCVSPSRTISEKWRVKRVIGPVHPLEILQLTNQRVYVPVRAFRDSPPLPSFVASSSRLSRLPLFIIAF